MEEEAITFVTNVTPYAVCPNVQVLDLQQNLKQEQIIVEEKKSMTQALIESIGQEKAVVDQAVEAGREDEEQAAKLQVLHRFWPCD